MVLNFLLIGKELSLGLVADFCSFFRFSLARFAFFSNVFVIFGLIRLFGNIKVDYACKGQLQFIHQCDAAEQNKWEAEGRHIGDWVFLIESSPVVANAPSMRAYVQ